MPLRTGLRLSGMEYKTVLVEADTEKPCILGNQVFGWILLERSQMPPGNHEYLLTFCRENALKDSPDMIRMGKRMDSCIRQLNSLTRIKKYAALHVSVSVGLFGIGLLSIGVYAYCMDWETAALFLIPAGVIHIIAPPVIYRTVRERKGSEIEPLIRKKQKEIEEVASRVRQIQERNRYD